MQLFEKYSKSFFRCLMILSLIVFQIICMFVLAYYLQRFAIFVYLALEILSLAILVPLLADSRNISYKLYWMSVILTLPIVGHIMYNIWGKDKASRSEHRKIQSVIDRTNEKQIFRYDYIEELKRGDPENGKIAEYLYRQGYPLYDHTSIAYIEAGEKAFEDMDEELQKASRFIFMSFFTIADGIILGRICEILEKKVREGVEVKILYDDAGSVFQVSDHTIDRLREVGVETVRFNPLDSHFHRLFLNYRNHQKIVVIDGEIAYTGGINASDRYANIRSPFGHWKDIAIKLTGDGVYSLSLIFLGMWEASGKKVDYDRYRTSRIFNQGGLCQPFADGPSNNPNNVAMDMFFHMITQARKELLIITPYLILDDAIRDILCLAAKSGVDVRIITPGIPDKKAAKLLTEWNYGHLLLAGIRIFEYVPGFSHAKVCINEFSGIVGTINMDFRSFFIHYETAVWTSEQEVIALYRKDYMDTLEKCREITYGEWCNRPLHKKVKQYILQIFKCQF